MLWETLTVPASRARDTVAVEAGGVQMDFGALEARALRVAGWLRAGGVQRGDRVALVLDRSLEAVAAIYGVLLAGAAYVPLDPVAPVPRNAVILGDAAPRAVVTAGRWGRRLAPLMAATGERPVLVLGARPRRWPSGCLASRAVSTYEGSDRPSACPRAPPSHRQRTESMSGCFHA